MGSTNKHNRTTIKFKTMKYSELDIRCWSTNKAFDTCYLCSRIMYCNLPEARKGRLKLQANRILKSIKVLAEQIDNIEKELK